MAQVYPEDRRTNYAIRGGHKAVLIDAWLDQSPPEPGRSPAASR
jgi:hypothetical protein